MSRMPLVLFQVYYQEDKPFDTIHASCDIIEHTVRSRFVGREHDLLALRCGFQHLGSKQSLKEITRCNRRIVEFMSSRSTDIVIVLNTHADAEDGGLVYSPNSTASLDAILKHVYGTIAPIHTAKSMLFLLCCGGLVRHAPTEIRRASEQFGAVFAFDAPTLDPILASNHFVTTIMEFSIFGEDSVWQALRRSAKPDVLFHTSVYAGIGGTIYRLCSAPLRRRPNGEDIRCCGQMAKYVKSSCDRVLYRCCQPAHWGSRFFRVALLPEVENERWIIGRSGWDRALLERI
ncbi:hypothetical protein C2E23DRAFT_722272 [Lenzites betulinus]|nr:hypothetical protein C2E23DRAFT_722272 [Lenzites betulinus]